MVKPGAASRACLLAGLVTLAIGGLALLMIDLSASAHARTVTFQPRPQMPEPERVPVGALPPPTLLPPPEEPAEAGTAGPVALDPEDTLEYSSVCELPEFSPGAAGLDVTIVVFAWRRLAS